MYIFYEEIKCVWNAKYTKEQSILEMLKKIQHTCCSFRTQKDLNEENSATLYAASATLYAAI
jgi:predicted fused transcriptional regulator/phosphomethylpyrimidine kinase